MHLLRELAGLIAHYLVELICRLEIWEVDRIRGREEHTQGHIYREVVAAVKVSHS